MPIFSAAIVILAIIAIFLFNSLIMKKNAANNALAGIDVQLKKRFDLIPHLTAAIQPRTEHENVTLARLTELRSKFDRNPPAAEKNRIDAESGAILRGIMDRIENDPRLKASENMDQIKSSLNETEARLAAARRCYNSAATGFNHAIETVPASLIAGFMHYSAFELFTAPESGRANADVKEPLDRR